MTLTQTMKNQIDTVAGMPVLTMSDVELKTIDNLPEEERAEVVGHLLLQKHPDTIGGTVDNMLVQYLDEPSFLGHLGQVGLSCIDMRTIYQTMVLVMTQHLLRTTRDELIEKGEYTQATQINELTIMQTTTAKQALDANLKDLMRDLPNAGTMYLQFGALAADMCTMLLNMSYIRDTQKMQFVGIDDKGVKMYERANHGGVSWSRVYPDGQVVTGWHTAGIGLGTESDKLADSIKAESDICTNCGDCNKCSNHI